MNNRIGERGLMSSAPRLNHWLAKLFFLVIPVAILFGAIAYGGWYGNLFFSVNSDAQIYPYLFHHLSAHDFIIPGNHSLFLKWPLFFLQASLPFNFLTFTTVNIGLFLATIAGWAALLIYLFGRRYLGLICLLLSALTVTSVAFPDNMVETTIRNIEYPIALAFVLLVHNILKGAHWGRLRIVLAAILSILFTAAVAGDSLLLAAFVVPVLLSIFLYWFQSGRWNRRLTTALSLVTGVALVSFGARSFTEWTGFVSLYFDPSFKNTIQPIDQFGPSVAHALSDLLTLYGANIFGRDIAVHNAIYFVNFAVLMLGLVGLFVAMIRVIKRYRSETASIVASQSFIMLTLGLSFITTFFSYALSGLVLHRTATDSFVSAENRRYLTLLPLLAIIGILYLVQLHGKKSHLRRIASVSTGIIFLALIVSSHSIRVEHHQQAIAVAAQHQTFDAIIKVAEENHANLVVGGYTDSINSRFWSHDKLFSISVSNCNYAQPGFNTRYSWYTNHHVAVSAIVVDRAGFDESYWASCSDDRIESIYGIPAKKIPIANGSAPSTMTVWVYNYDVRQKIINVVVR
jgi:hypothetical protein